MKTVFVVMHPFFPVFLRTIEDCDEAGASVGSRKGSFSTWVDEEIYAEKYHTLEDAQRVVRLVRNIGDEPRVVAFQVAQHPKTAVKDVLPEDDEAA